MAEYKVSTDTERRHDNNWVEKHSLHNSLHDDSKASALMRHKTFDSTGLHFLIFHIFLFCNFHHDERNRIEENEIHGGNQVKILGILGMSFSINCVN